MPLDGASRHHRAILSRAVQKGIAGRNLFTGRALERFVRIVAAEKFFYLCECDGVAHDRIALHFLRSSQADHELVGNLSLRSQRYLDGSPSTMKARDFVSFRRIAVRSFMLAW